MPNVDSLPEDLKRVREIAPEIVSSLEKKAPYASVLVKRKEPGEAILKSEEERVTTMIPYSHVKITVWNGETFFSLVTSDFDKDNLFKMAEELKDSIAIKPSGYEIGPGDALNEHFMNRCEIDPSSVQLNQKKEFCNHAYDILKGYDSRISPDILYASTKEHDIFVDRSKLLSQTSNFIYFWVNVQAKKDDKANKLKTNFERFTGAGGYEKTKLFTDENIQKIGEDAIILLDAGQIRPGRYDVILDPDLTGLLVHESFGHGCEYDAIMQKRAKSAEYIGKRVGSELVTIKDGGIRNQYGSIFFSDDGVISKEPTVLVDKGILQPTMLTDLYTYTMMKDKSSGLRLTSNGRCQDASRIIYPRMTETYLESLKREEGGKTFEEMVSEIDDGYFIEKVLSGMEDPLGWGLQLKGLKATRIRNGKLTEEVFNPVDITGYVPDALGNISAVGTEVYFMGGSCGKGHKEYIRTSLGGPYIRTILTIGSL
jgi:TldD protein